MRLSPLLALVLAACGPAEVALDDTGKAGHDGDTDADTDSDADTDTDTDTDTGGGTVVSGEIAVSPASLELPTVFVGGSASAALLVENVGNGDVNVTVSVDGAMGNAWTASLSDPAPAPGGSATITLTLTPTTWGDHSVEVVVDDTLGDGHVTVPVTAWAQEDGDHDGYGSVESGGDDCDDEDAAIHPGAEDAWYDGVDSDCAGNEDYDQDGDGAKIDVDCDDGDATVYPGAPDAWYDGVDSDCAGNDDFDQDADGYVDEDYGGTDCDDEDAGIHPGAVEVWYDSVDQDCDGNDSDQDGDGAGIGTDCDDTDATSYPGATEVWYDGIDEACDGGDDYDQDGDGVDVDTDCVDTDATITGPTTETWDGTDQDCDGLVDDFAIGDVRSGVLYGPTASLGLGARGFLAMDGDVTGDGADDAIVSSASSGYGYAWLVKGSSASTASGSVQSYDTAEITGSSSSYLIGVMAGPLVDFTGDGDADPIISASSSSSYYTYGRSYLLTGGSSMSGSISTSSTYEARFTGDSSTDFTRVSAAADIDGDGVYDVVMGSPYDNDASSYWSGDYYTGNVGIFQGGSFSGDYDLNDADDQIHGEDDYDYLGYWLTTGDVDGDGYDDILAGAPGEDTGGSDAGAVYLFTGNASFYWNGTADTAREARIAGGAASDDLGSEPLATPGDLDGDGKLDVALSSSDAGKVYVFFDGSTLTGNVSVSSADLTVSGTADAFATAVAYDTDFDGDGADDLFVGASGDDTAGVDAGAVWMFDLSATPSGTWTSANAEATFWGASAGDALGAGLAGGGDLDSDGTEDLLVGATGSDGVASGGGAVYVLLGR